MATIFSSFLFSYGVVDIRYSLLVSANKLCFVLIGFGMFPTLFCSVALRTGGTVFPHTCESWVKTTHVGILKWDQLGRAISILPLLHVFVYVAGFSERMKCFFLPLEKCCFGVPGSRDSSGNGFSDSGVGFVIMAVRMVPCLGVSMSDGVVWVPFSSRCSRRICK